MFQIFSGDTANDVWREAAAVLLASPTEVLSQQSRNGPTRELLRAAITIRNPRQRWVYARHPVLSPAFALAEVVWIMAGRNDAISINYFNKRLAEYAGGGSTYHGAYGFRLRRHFAGIDQLARAYQTLVQQPNSRQVVLQIWDPRSDLPMPDGTPAATDIPCNILSLLNIRGGQLEWTQVIRSNDIFLGLPHNLVQFTTLHEVMAGWLGVEVGSYNQISNSLHLYEKDNRQDLISNQAIQVSNTDNLALPQSLSEPAFAELAECMDRVAAPTTSAVDLIDMVGRNILPTPFKNMLCILCAEGARRRQNMDAANEILEVCTNPALVYLMQKWFHRWEQ